MSYIYIYIYNPTTIDHNRPTAPSTHLLSMGADAKGFKNPLFGGCEPSHRVFLIVPKAVL